MYDIAVWYYTYHNLVINRHAGKHRRDINKFHTNMHDDDIMMHKNIMQNNISENQSIIFVTMYNKTNI